MSDLISRADAIDAVCNAQCELDVPHYPQCDQVKYCDEIKALLALPSADAESDDLIIKGAKGIQDGLYNIKDGELFQYKAKGGTVRVYSIVPSAEAVTIHEDGTLEVKVPNAQKVGRVLVMDTDSHIGGGLFYPDDAEAEFADLPDIPRAYYEKIVGNMAHEINMLKEQLESADAVDKPPRAVKLTEDIEITLDEESYEIGYTHGQMADRPKGEWIDLNGDGTTYKCSNCNETFCCNDNYCPSCGARMRGAE